MKRIFSSFLEAENSEETVINLTPLIDVVFVLLITFIMIAPILKLDRIELAPAKQTKAQEKIPSQTRNSISIRVFDDNSITINNRPIELEHMLPTLLSLKKNHPDVTPMVFHDKKAAFGTYQIVKNSVEMAGFEQMDILLQP
jgi:biopolymer transport protein ExbD